MSKKSEELNPTIRTQLNHKSIRDYKNKMPSRETIEQIVKAGQQAPFASQLYSVILATEPEKQPFHAPLLFTILIDFHKLELIMERRDWEMVSNDLQGLWFGIQDASYMAQNMVVAGESFGLGSCFLGNAPYQARKIARDYNLPKRVFPLVQLAMGYPREAPPTRPRYPLDFVLFEDEYPEFTDEQIENAMNTMDEGYLAQNYYEKAGAKIPLEEKEETFTYDDYSWTEHISRKWGQWYESPDEFLELLAEQGFNFSQKDED